MVRVFDPVLIELRETLLRMAGRAEAILEKSLRSVWERDLALAAEVARDDLDIDRLDVEIDDKVLKALALQAPVAGDLREVVAIKMIANDLERIGDLARNIAKSGAHLAGQPMIAIDPMLALLASDTQQILQRALDSFSRSDVEAARSVLDEDDRIDAQEDAVIASVLREIPESPSTAAEAVDVILIAKNLERVGDHATNIAEGVILIFEARNVKHASKLAV
ncbi:MAG: phosphate signaling complex protein PhoU [Deltaproteobacteria bacterium]|nr:phosphate signaling complex protein PhoU [Deltaproteobacteria bacterium]MBW2399672.1 phosphate signaling complex protein PhoU [Deltaproteobacteria bacterium]MBW2665211.1 phosphate signaling complex protein PhoU [Deltaproteobacteria bacterium]